MDSIFKKEFDDNLDSKDYKTRTLVGMLLRGRRVTLKKKQTSLLTSAI